MATKTKLLRIQRVGWDHYRLVWYDPKSGTLEPAALKRFERARDAVVYGIEHDLGYAASLPRKGVDRS